MTEHIKGQRMTNRQSLQTNEILDYDIPVIPPLRVKIESSGDHEKIREWLRGAHGDLEGDVVFIERERDNLDSIEKEYANKLLENAGYTHDESVCLAKFVARIRTINPALGFDEIMDSVKAFGFTPRSKEEV